MPDRAGPVGLLGHGLLRDAIAAELADRAVRLAPDGPPDGLVMLVVATDAWDLSGHPDARRLAAGRMPWLPVYTELSDVLIGPREEPGRAGCVACAGARRHRCRADSQERRELHRQHWQRLAARPSCWLTGLAAQLVATLVLDEIDALATGPPPRTRRALLRLGLKRLNLTRHRFLPDPLCRVCGGRPDDAPELARPELPPRRAHRPGSYRSRDLPAELEALTETYVDREVGLIRHLAVDSSGGLAVGSAPVGLRGSRDEAGFGRAASFRASRVTALLEALERYGSVPGGRRTTVEASHQELAGKALDPRTLGLHPAERYAQPGFALQPFAPDRRYRWVWGWSFARGEPLLVPERCAYYGLPPSDSDPGFGYEISNGCALGGCLAEAILYGILEVAERDAFLLTWYARLPAPRIDLAGTADRAVPLLAATIQAETGYQLHLFDTTVEQGIPCVWALGTNPDPADGRPALVCAAGAHPDRERAIRAALSELAPAIVDLADRYAAPGQSERARAMVVDPELVREMADHALLYADPHAAARLDFLAGSPAVRPVDRVGRADRGGFASDDLSEQLQEAVRRYTAHGLDVIVVDQTAPEHRAGGLHCVKVLIPGTLPMTFGHAYRRVVGLPRLHQVPQRLGYRRDPLPPAAVNPHPHPFP